MTMAQDTTAILDVWGQTLTIVRKTPTYSDTGMATMVWAAVTTATGDISQAAGTFIQGVGGGAGTDFLLIGRYLYTAADTVDVVFTAATGGSPTTGALDFYMWVAKVIP